MIVGDVPHTTQSPFFDRNFTLRNCVSEPSNNNNRDPKVPL